MGLGAPQLPMYAIARRVEAIYTRYAIAGSIAAAIGLAMVASSFLIRPKR